MVILLLNKSKKELDKASSEAKTSNETKSANLSAIEKVNKLNKEGVSYYSNELNNAKANKIELENKLKTAQDIKKRADETAYQLASSPKLYFSTKNSEAYKTSRDISGQASARILEYKVGVAAEKASILNKELNLSIYNRQFQKTDATAKKLSEEISNNNSKIKNAENYKQVSDNYTQNLKKQTINDIKQTAENIRKRMWGG